MSTSYPKIDIHCHTTNRPLSHTVSPDAGIPFIHEEMLKHNVQHTLLLATYFPRKGTGVSNFRMKDWIDRGDNHDLSPDPLYAEASTLNPKPPFIMFGSLDFETYFNQGLSELHELASRKLIRGVKVYSGYQLIELSKLKRLIQEICLPFDLPMMFHTGDCTGTGNYADVASFDPIFEEFQSTPFLFSHLCNPQIEKAIERVKRYPNVYTDMSGLIHSGKDDHELPGHVVAIRKFYETCGIDRLMWGTDFPVQTHAHSVKLAEEALHGYATEDELQKFYFKTAARILKL